MTKYHINSKGEPGNCSATKGNCPYGDEERHYDTPEDARVAYEVTQMAKTMPEGLSLDEKTRKLLKMPSANDPAVTGIEPQPTSASDKLAADKEFQAKLDAIRARGRQIYENSIGGRTYKISFGNEKMSMIPGSYHILEVDAPYGPQAMDKFKEFVHKGGFSYEIRQSRASLFKGPNNYQSPSFEDFKTEAKRIAPTIVKEDTFTNAYKRLKKAQSKLDSQPYGLQDEERLRLLRDRDYEFANYYGVHTKSSVVNSETGEDYTADTAKKMENTYKSLHAIENAASDEEGKDKLALSLGIPRDRVDVAIMRADYRYRDFRRMNELTLEELGKNNDFLNDTSSRLKITREQVTAIMNYTQSFSEV